MNLYYWRQFSGSWSVSVISIGLRANGHSASTWIYGLCTLGCLQRWQSSKFENCASPIIRIGLLSTSALLECPDWCSSGSSHSNYPNRTSLYTTCGTRTFLSSPSSPSSFFETRTRSFDQPRYGHSPSSAHVLSKRLLSNTTSGWQAIRKEYSWLSLAHVGGP